MEWRAARIIDCDLILQPRIWLWRSGSDISIEWDNRGATFNGKPIYTAGVGSEVNSVRAFVELFEKFEVNLLNDVFPADLIVASVPPIASGLRIVNEYEQLTSIRNQVLKSRENYLIPTVTDWDKVRKALREIMKG
jgi:Family of unknown function (DUF5984)